MNENDILLEIKSKNYDIDFWIDSVINNVQIRNIVIENLKHTNIMIYYHCFEIIKSASKTNPNLFYPYWDSIQRLIYHENSYHRDISLTIISHLVVVDIDNKFNDFIHTYIKLLFDEKFMTALCCLRCIKTIINSTSIYNSYFELLLLGLNRNIEYTEKQSALYIADVIDILSILYPRSKRKSCILELVNNQINSISPKTRKRAKQFFKYIVNTVYD